MRSVALPGVALALAGVIAGSVMAGFATQMLRHLVWGVRPGDPLTFVAAVGVGLLGRGRCRQFPAGAADYAAQSGGDAAAGVVGQDSSPAAGVHVGLTATLEGKGQSGANQDRSGAAIESSRNRWAAEPGSERPYGDSQKSEPQQPFRNVNEGE
jgi:hypothetical protein